MRRTHKVERWGKVGDSPRIGPCRDPLALWFLEVDSNGARVRRYYADRPEAARALSIARQLGVDPEGMMPPR